MKTIREAINSGARDIYLNNRTLIVHLDHGQTWDAMCPPKTIQGKKVYRWITCRITNTCNPICHKEILKPYALDWGKTGPDYIVPERIMNIFISLNGGIDEYRTDYWSGGWMYY